MVWLRAITGLSVCITTKLINSKSPHKNYTMNQHTTNITVFFNVTSSVIRLSQGGHVQMSSKFGLVVANDKQKMYLKTIQLHIFYLFKSII